MHRLLDRYTALVWNEAGARDDSRARLAADHPAQARTLERRVAGAVDPSPPSSPRHDRLTPAAQTQQMLLPLHDEDALGRWPAGQRDWCERSV